MGDPYAANDDDNGPARARLVIYVIGALAVLVGGVLIWVLMTA